MVTAEQTPHGDDQREDHLMSSTAASAGVGGTRGRGGADGGGEEASGAVCEAEGLNKTTILNRAAQVYEAVAQAIDAGHHVYVDTGEAIQQITLDPS